MSFSPDFDVPASVRPHPGRFPDRRSLLRHRQRRLESSLQSRLPVLQHAFPYVHVDDHHYS